MASFFIPLISLDPKNSRKTSFLASPWLILGLDPSGPLAPTEGNCFPAVPAGESGFPAGAPGWNLEKPIPRKMFFGFVGTSKSKMMQFIILSFFDGRFFSIYTRAGGVRRWWFGWFSGSVNLSFYPFDNFHCSWFSGKSSEAVSMHPPPRETIYIQGGSKHRKMKK